MSRYCDQFGAHHVSKTLIKELPGWSGAGALAVGGEAEGMEFVQPGEGMALGAPFHNYKKFVKKIMG